MGNSITIRGVEAIAQRIEPQDFAKFALFMAVPAFYAGWEFKIGSRMLRQKQVPQKN